ncbi:MAG: sporulation integral membrane protein YtvI [Oscillospiraceae bacterium]
MTNVEKMRAFIIKFVFYTIILGLIYLGTKYVLPFLTPFIFGFFFAFILKPIINWIVSKAHINRKPVSVLVLIVFYFVVGTLLTVLGTRVVVMLRDVFMSLPAFYDNSISPALMSIQDKVEALVLNLNPTMLDFIDAAGNSIANSLSGFVTSLSTGAISLVTSTATRVPSFFVKFILTIIVSFFCVVDYYKITGFFIRQLSEKNKQILFKIKSNGIDVIAHFAKAYAILLTVTFVELTIGLSLLRVDNALLIALAVACVDILPVIGTGTVIIPWGIITLILGNIPLGAGLLILYAIVTIVRQSLEPRVIGKQIGLYPLVTLGCMFVGAQLFGIVGLFGLPIAVTTILQLSKSEDFKIFK